MKTKFIKISMLIIIFILGIAFPIGDTKSLLMILISVVILFLTGLWTPFLIQYN